MLKHEQFWFLYSFISLTGNTNVLFLVLSNTYGISKHPIFSEQNLSIVHTKRSGVAYSQIDPKSMHDTF